MSLPSNQLDAFFAVAQSGSFSKAAVELHITQSALSQRILNLEDELGVTLILRESSGLRLTEPGLELLKYVQKKRTLEEEFQSQIGKKKRSKSDELAGRIRIACFSSVMESVLFPALNDLLQKNSELMIEISAREVRDLEGLLRQGTADFIVTNEEWTREGLRGHLLGHEENILIQPKIPSDRSAIFLDHDSEDRTTKEFWKLNGDKNKVLRRSYLDDTRGILEGVALGWGSAVIPSHLLTKPYQARVKLARGLKPLKTPVWLYHYDQPYYSQVESAVIDALTKTAAKYLKALES